ncbi:MAG TPA: ribonuclease III domain-containing protein [Bacilli bacterium]|nr:ribonuclease III domain-containing protein [Bacilli bacterium]
MPNNPLTLAYLGDAVYELYIRQYLISQGRLKPGDLQKASINYVSAKSQCSYLEKLIQANFLTTEEIAITKWGRNAHGGKAKSTDIVTYRQATGLETLIGKLYLTNNINRIEEIIDFIVGN